MVENVLYSIVPVITMVIGFYFGYKLRDTDKKDKLPDLKTPRQIIREHKEKVEEEKEIAEAKKWIEEIDNYNGEFGK